MKNRIRMAGLTGEYRGRTVSVKQGHSNPAGEHHPEGTRPGMVPRVPVIRRANRTDYGTDTRGRVRRWVNEQGAR